MKKKLFYFLLKEIIESSTIYFGQKRSAIYSFNLKITLVFANIWHGVAKVFLFHCFLNSYIFSYIYNHKLVCNIPCYTDNFMLELNINVVILIAIY